MWLSSVLIVTSQNSAADSNIDKLMNSEYMVVRAHSLGLERKTMISSLSSNTNDETKSQIEDTQSNFEDDDDADSDMRDAEMRVTTEFMQLCEQVYTDKDSILRPTDPRMQKVLFAIHTWVPKVAAILPSKWSVQPNEDQIKAGKDANKPSHLQWSHETLHWTPATLPQNSKERLRYHELWLDILARETQSRDECRCKRGEKLWRCRIS